MDEFNMKFEPVGIERIPLPIDEMRVLAELTVELCKLRQNECKHLAIENIGPEIWHNLLKATYAPPMYIATADSAGASAE